jgi:HSP20 family protein
MTEKTSAPAASGKTNTSIEVKSGTTAPAPSDGRTKRAWDPFEMRDELYNDMLRLWGESFALMPGPISLPRHRLVLAPRTWAPSTDVYEENGSVVVKAELPGLNKEDITVSLSQGNLVIRGTRTAESEVKEHHIFRRERTYGSFYRRIPVPTDVKADQITASYTNGVLEVRIPLPAQDQTPVHNISIS